MVDKIDDNFYYEDNVAYDRVTRILNCFPKPALYSWYAKYGLIKCKEIMKEARRRGTEIHTAIHLNLKEDRHIQSIDEIVNNSINEFLVWKNANNPQPERLEYNVINKKDQYGGTIDFIGKINGIRTIADWKSSGAIYEDYPLQLAAYLEAYEQMHPDEEPILMGKIVVFRCDDEGHCKTMEETLHRERLKDLYSVFLAVKAIFEYKYRRK